MATIITAGNNKVTIDGKDYGVEDLKYIPDYIKGLITIRQQSTGNIVLSPEYFNNLTNGTTNQPFASTQAVIDYLLTATSGGGGGSSETPATIKSKYESNANTNAYTNNEKTKLGGIAVGATAYTDAMAQSAVAPAIASKADAATALTTDVLAAGGGGGTGKTIVPSDYTIAIGNLTSYWTSEDYYFATAKTVTKLVIANSASGIIKVARGTISPRPIVQGTSAWTKIAEISVSVISGTTDYVVNIPVNAGEYLMFLVDTTGVMKYKNDIGKILSRFSSTSGSVAAQVLNDLSLGIGFEAPTGDSLKAVQLLNFVAQNGSSTTNYLKSKKILVAGDSLAKGHTLPADQVYGSLISIRNNMAYTNAGINGNRLTDTGGTGECLATRYSSMPDGMDIVIFEILTNDAQAAIAIGTDSDTGVATVKGALNTLCTGARTKWPLAKICFISPELRLSGTPRTYVDALIAIASEKFSIPVFDSIKNCGLSWANAAQVAALTLNDGYHRNAAGMSSKSYTIEQFIRGL